MSLIFIDGFDHWDTGQYNDKWTYKSAGTSTQTIYSRWSTGKGLTVDGINYIYKNFPSNYSTIVVGWAMGLADASYGGQHVTFMDGSTAQVSLHLNTTTKQIDVYRGDSTALLGSSSGLNLDNFINSWLYIEFKATINSSSGIIQVYVNESLEIDLSSQNTQVSGNAYMNRLYLERDYFDDLYVDDSDFHGECRVRTFVPDSDGSLNDFTASAGNRYECVDEIGPDEDTTYVYGDTVNYRQSFGITTGALGTILGMQLNNVLKKDDVGTVGIKNLVRSNSTNYLETNEYELLTDYVVHSALWEDDPDDSNPWTQTKLEAAEFGLEITTIP